MGTFDFEAVVSRAKDHPDEFPGTRRWWGSQHVRADRMTSWEFTLMAAGHDVADFYLFRDTELSTDLDVWDNRRKTEAA